VEYDAFADRLATFLLTEIIPEVPRRYSITDGPDGWAICGRSSGGNGAFTAAWLRPDKFRRGRRPVHLGSGRGPWRRLRRRRP